MGSSESKEGGKIQMVGATFMWKIENYSKIPYDCEKWGIRSPSFAIAEQSYFLELNKNIDLSIRLNRDDDKKSSDNSPRFQCKISLIDSKGFERYTKIKEMVEVKKSATNEEKIEILLKIPDNDLKKYRNVILPQDTLNISFNGTIISDGVSLVSLRQDTNIFLGTLSTDFGRFYDNKLDSDVVLKADDTAFHAHRTILSARSTVFAAMFQHDTLEKRKGKVDIPDIESSTLEDMLHYIYTGKIRAQNSRTAALMYRASDKYALPELKEVCRKNIIASLTTKNICYAAKLADIYGEESIEKAVVVFLQENRAEILESEVWKSFMAEKPILAGNILCSALKNK